MKKLSTGELVSCGMVAALYTVLCTMTSPISYGMIQIRIAEALTLMPVFSPIHIWGVTVGCMVSNLIGFLTGANPLGYIDIVVGSAATLAAGVLSYLTRNVRFGGLPVLSAIPPILVNAVVIGAELTLLEANALIPTVFLINAAWIAAGQAISCFAVGLPLVYTLQKTGLANRYLIPVHDRIQRRPAG